MLSRERILRDAKVPLKHHRRYSCRYSCQYLVHTIVLREVKERNQNVAGGERIPKSDTLEQELFFFLDLYTKFSIYIAIN
jgi:hypothetical protein